MKRLIAFMVIAALTAPGCAARTPDTVRASAPGSDSRRDRSVMLDYIRQLPVGSRVKVTRADGKVLRGTLMRRDTDPIVLQLRTRLPEAPVEIAVRDIARLEIQKGGSVGRAIAIGAAAGAGASLGVFFVLVAIFAD
jgi:hypothetical protein